MGSIGRELIRRAQERIIAMEREIDWMRSRGGFENRIAEYQQKIQRERSALDAQIKLEGQDG